MINAMLLWLSFVVPLIFDLVDCTNNRTNAHLTWVASLGVASNGHHAHFCTAQTDVLGHCDGYLLVTSASCAQRIKESLSIHKNKPSGGSSSSGSSRQFGKKNSLKGKVDVLALQGYQLGKRKRTEQGMEVQAMFVNGDAVPIVDAVTHPDWRQHDTSITNAAVDIGVVLLLWPVLWREPDRSTDDDEIRTYTADWVREQGEYKLKEKETDYGYNPDNEDEQLRPFLTAERSSPDVHGYFDPTPGSPIYSIGNNDGKFLKYGFFVYKSDEYDLYLVQRAFHDLLLNATQHWAHGQS